MPAASAVFEWALIASAIELCGGNVSEAARRLGVPLATLRYKVESLPKRLDALGLESAAPPGRPPGRG